MNWWALVITVLLLVFNGLFVALEFALVGSRQARLVPMVEAGNTRAKRGLEAMANLDLELAGAQLGITIASLGLGVAAEPAIAHGLSTVIEMGPLSRAASETIALVASLSIITFLHLVVGEMVPKNLTLVDPERTLMALSGPNRYYMAIFRPLLRLLNSMSRGCLRLVGIKPRSALSTSHTADELAAMFALSHEEGMIEDFAAELLTGVLDFKARAVGSIVVGVDSIAHIDTSTTVAEAEAVIVATGHSRLAVIGDNIDDVLGFVHSKDLLTLSDTATDAPVPTRIIRRMLVVACDTALDDLLMQMRTSRVHFALVVDADGHTAGIVTIEDLLEELVGDIVDESDQA